MTVSHVPLSQLTIDKINVRKTDVEPSPAFVMNVRAIGIKIPLLVRLNGDGYKVADGGKRLRALQAIAKAKQDIKGIAVTEAYPVPVTIEEATDEQARDTSLALNLFRDEMHPVDEFEACTAFIAGGDTVEGIAARYGKTRKEVDQALALGALSPTIRAAWRDGEIKAETAQMFTLSKDQKRQDQVFAKLQKEAKQQGQWAFQPHNVRTQIVGQQDRDVAKFVTFVGKEAYEAAGGKVVIDLFKEQHAVSDPALAKQLADAKLMEECQRLVADGWSWALPADHVKDRYSYRGTTKKLVPTPEEKTQLDALRKIVDDVENAEDYDRDMGDAQSNAQNEIERIEGAIMGRAFKPAEKAKLGCFVEIDDAGALGIHFGLEKPSGTKATTNIGTLGLGNGSVTTEKKVPPSNKLSNALKQRLESQLARATQDALVTDASYTGELTALLAKVVASQIEPDRIGYMPRKVSEKLSALRDAALPKIVNASIRKRFDAKDYFSGAPKGIVLKAIGEAVNADEQRKLAGKTKAEIWKWAVANVPKTGWLPAEMRVSGYDGPGTKKAPAKKAAKKKAA